MSPNTIASSDGVELTAYDLGGAGRPALLVHGAGLNGLSLRPLAGCLARRLSCRALDLRGHGSSSTPATFAWEGFVSDVRAAVDQLGLRRPVASGHSLGATAVLGAEAESPGIFAFLFCYEPIVHAPDIPEAPDEDIAEAVRHRQAVFPSRTAAADRYRQRWPFVNWDPAALAGYVGGGFVDLPDGSVELACAPENEARIYEAAERFDVYGRLGAIACPVTIGRGTASDVLSAQGADAIVSQLVNASIDEFVGFDHFGPFTDPSIVAEAVFSAIDTAGA